ncbi:MAG TPA: DUF371 domain-containing protein [Methanocorpusculum sp.]|nr:DUF371 domain-containing protein [Methanocorpusculum sp.]
MISETIHCKGHINVAGNHKSTFEITKEAELSPKGDCIIGVCADKGAADLSPEFKAALQKDGAELETKLICGDIEYVVKSKGGAGLSLTHPEDLVWRKSEFTCPRTIGNASDAAARDLPRELMERLKKGEELIVILTVRG